MPVTLTPRWGQVLVAVCLMHTSELRHSSCVASQTNLQLPNLSPTHSPTLPPHPTPPTTHSPGCVAADVAGPQRDDGAIARQQHSGGQGGLAQAIQVGISGYGRGQLNVLVLEAQAAGRSSRRYTQVVMLAETGMWKLE